MKQLHYTVGHFDVDIMLLGIRWKVTIFNIKVENTSLYNIISQSPSLQFTKFDFVLAK